jgi:hypothetical protein
MDEKDYEIAHPSILARTANTGNYGANWHKLTIRHRQDAAGLLGYGYYTESPNGPLREHRTH